MVIDDGSIRQKHLFGIPDFLAIQVFVEGRYLVSTTGLDVHDEFEDFRKICFHPVWIFNMCHDLRIIIRKSLFGRGVHQKAVQRHVANQYRFEALQLLFRKRVEAVVPAEHDRDRCLVRSDQFQGPFFFADRP